MHVAASRKTFILIFTTVENLKSHLVSMMLLFLQEKEKDHEYWPPVDTRDHILGKPRSNASADEEVSFKLELY
jgi:hypothetical protein